MLDKEPVKFADLDRLREWMDAVGGSLYLGESEFKSIKVSKDSDKLTIVLKKKKQKKAKKSADRT
jgi:hypothetical protein